MSLQETEFVKGKVVVKYSKKHQPQHRVLKLNEDCILWCKPPQLKRPQTLRLFSVIRANLLTHTEAVACRLPTAEARCVFTLETTFRTYKFKVEDAATAKRWVDELKRRVKSAHARENTPTTDENELTCNSALQETADDDVLGDSSRSEAVLSKVQKTLNKYVGMLVPTDNIVDCFSQLSRSRRSLIADLQQSVADQHNECRLSVSQESQLKRQLSSLETSKAAQSRKSLDEMRGQVISQQKLRMELGREVQETTKANLDFMEQEQVLKRELGAAQVLAHNLGRHVTKKPTSTPDLRLEALQRGFHGYICCLGDAEISEQINLTPRRPAEDGIYKKRLITVSQGNNVLVWKAIGLFTKKKAVLKFKDINKFADGSPDIVRLQPFPGFVYLTLHSKHLTLVIALEPELSFYLDAIKHLYLTALNKSVLSVPRSSGLSVQRNCKAHLGMQSNLFQKLLTRYISSLEVSSRQESICDRGGSDSIAEYGEEISQLRGLIGTGVKGYIAGGTEEYLRQEKSKLEERLIRLSEIAMKVADHLN
jgi:hypothetical protein